MAASNERIREVVEAYVDRVSNGSVDEVLALYADGATVEDPVGTAVREGYDAIREFYAPLEELEQEGRLISARIAAGEAAFQFELATKAGDRQLTTMSSLPQNARIEVILPSSSNVMTSIGDSV